MRRRRKSPSQVDLQAVLRFIAATDGVAYTPLVALITATFGCRDRAAKDNISVLVKGGWLPPFGTRTTCKRYVLTQKGRADMRRHFGEGALDVVGGAIPRARAASQDGVRRLASRR
jgi:hypothetical protein